METNKNGQNRREAILTKEIIAETIVGSFFAAGLIFSVYFTAVTILKNFIK